MLYIQVTDESMKKHLSEACMRLSFNSSRILKELAKCIKFMRKSNCMDLLLREQNNGVKELDNALRSLPPSNHPTKESMDLGFVSSFHGRELIVIISLLIEISARIIGVVEAVNLLAEQACFKPAKNEMEQEDEEVDMVSRKNSFVVTLGPEPVRTTEEA